MKPAVLVTGGAGYVGSHACKALSAAGYLPVSLDSLVRGHDWAVRWGPLVRCDVGDTDRVREVIRDHRIEAVLHFAAFAYVGESMREPRKYFSNNVATSLKLLDAVVAEKVRHVVFSSTCATYGYPDEVPIDEHHRQRPVNPYGESKLFVERALRWCGESHDLRYVALRYFNAAGADPDGDLGEAHDPETHLIPLAMQAATSDLQHVEIFGTDYDTPDGTAVRDYVHVADLADAHVRALQYLRSSGESTALNLGTGTGHSVRKVISTVADVAGRSVPIIEGPRRPGDPPALVADPSAARAVLGWDTSHSDLATMVETAWRWHEATREKLAYVASAGSY